MKVLIVLCAVAACASAKPQLLGYPFGLGLASPYTYNYSPYLFSSPTLGYSTYSAYSGLPLSPISYAAAAPAPITYAAPAPAPIAYASPAQVATAAAIGLKTQYHAQNELGEASYGHSEPTQSHNAVQDAYGNKIGSFSYTSPDGRILRTNYVADALGYRVASNALPVASALPVADTPEVSIARAQHLAAVANSVHHRSRRQAIFEAPLAYSTPLAYTSHIAPIAYTAPLSVSRPATLTQVVNNPGHAVSYRVD